MVALNSDSADILRFFFSPEDAKSVFLLKDLLTDGSNLTGNDWDD